MVAPALLDLIAGARPNFVKLAPLREAFARDPRVRVRVVHTGQHHDTRMSDIFFEDLDLPEPDLHLGVGSLPHGAQIGRILEAYEAVLLRERPAATVVLGDVNSTVAAALAAARNGVPVHHVEAGLRSFDRVMPEEQNRVLTDHLSDLLFVTESAGIANLRREGITGDRVRLVGNVMVDSLMRHAPQARSRRRAEAFGLEPRAYALLTLHRPANVDEPEVLHRLMGVFARLAETLPILFPVHPRTRRALDVPPPGVGLVEPQGYLDMLSLLQDARVVLTDSGGLQTEAVNLGVPCLTLRETTEHPSHVRPGFCRLTGTSPERIERAFADALAGAFPRGTPELFGDGLASVPIARQVADRVLGG